MLESIKGTSGWCCKDCKAIYKLWKRRIVKQDELDGDLEFITTIGLRGKLSSYEKMNRIQSWKWRGVCKAYKTPYHTTTKGVIVRQVISLDFQWIH